MPLESLQNGRYQTVRELGSGSMGEVYLVDDTVIGRQVAIKIMRADPAAYPDTEAVKDAVRLFKREAQAIARLEHPNILPLYDFGEEKREKTVFTYMVMPHCQEGSLSDWLRRNRPGKPLPLGEAVYFIEQAAEALQYAHEHGIIHQDVKPSNFLLRTHASGQLLPDLLLADFGIARMGTGATITTISAGPRGTPRYMPPEQWEGKPLPASDQYALAVMAYQLLTFTFPFKGEQMLQLMYQHLQNAPEPPGGLNPVVSPAVDAVILRALAKKPVERFPSVKEFASALRKAVQENLPVRPAQAPVAQSTPVRMNMPNETVYNTSTPTLPPRSLPEGSGQSPLVVPTSSSYSPSVRPAPMYSQQQVTPAANTPVPSPASWVPPVASSTPPPVRPVPSRKASSGGKALLFVSLTLLVVLAGAGLAYYYYYSHNGNSGNNQKKVNKHDNGNNNPYISDMPALRFSDPLSQPAMWQSLPYDQLTDGFCLFQQGSYHVSSNKTHSYTLCPAANGQPTTDDMTFEIHMQILHGDCGGVLFRGDYKQGNFYYYDVCFDGHHYLVTYKNFALLQQLPTRSAQFPPLQADANISVTLGIVARGSSLAFYLDGQRVDQVTDATYTSGQIALFCFAVDNPTEVVFSKARLWTA